MPLPGLHKALKAISTFPQMTGRLNYKLHLYLLNSQWLFVSKGVRLFRHKLPSDVNE